MSSFPFCDSVHTWHKPSILFPTLWFSPRLAQTKCPLSHSLIQSTPGTNQVSTFPFSDSVYTWHKPSVLFPILWFSPHLAQTKCPLSHYVIQSTPGTNQVSSFPFCDSVHTWHKPSVHFPICGSVHTWHKPSFHFPILWFSLHLAKTKCPLSHSVIQSTTGTNQVSTFPLCDSVHIWHKPSVHFLILWFSPQLPHGKWPTDHSRRDSHINPRPRWPARPNWRIVIYSTAKHRLSSVILLWRWAYAFRSSSVSLFHPCHIQQSSVPATTTLSEILPSFNPWASTLFYGTGPHQLLWAALRATSGKITSCIPNGLNYCVNYIDTYKLDCKPHDTTCRAGDPCSNGNITTLLRYCHLPSWPIPLSTYHSGYLHWPTEPPWS